MCSQEVLNGSTLGEKFIGGLLHAGLRDFIIEAKSGDWSVLSWSSGAWEGEHDTLWNIIELSISLESNGLPFITSINPVTHVVNGSITSGSSRGELSELNNLSSSLLNSWSELISDPASIDEVSGSFTTYSGVSDIWVHGG